MVLSTVSLSISAGSVPGVHGTAGQYLHHPQPAGPITTHAHQESPLLIRSLSISAGSVPGVHGTAGQYLHHP